MASAPVVARDVVTLVYTATIVLKIAFINVFTVFAVSLKACFTRARVGALSVLTNSVDVTPVTLICALILTLWTGDALASI